MRIYFFLQIDPGYFSSYFFAVDLLDGLNTGLYQLLYLNSVCFGPMLSPENSVERSTNHVKCYHFDRYWLRIEAVTAFSCLERHALLHVWNWWGRLIEQIEKMVISCCCFDSYGWSSNVSSTLRCIPKQITPVQTTLICNQRLFLFRHIQSLDLTN